MEAVAASVARPAALSEAVRRLRAHARRCAWSRFDAKVRGRRRHDREDARAAPRRRRRLGQWRGFAADARRSALTRARAAVALRLRAPGAGGC